MTADEMAAVAILGLFTMAVARRDKGLVLVAAVLADMLASGVEAVLPQ